MPGTRHTRIRSLLTRKKLWGILLAMLASVLLLDLAVNWIVESAARGRMYSQVQDVPERTAALVLGCASRVAPGMPNAYFLNRIAAAAALYRAGKVEFVIASGDNQHWSYDEPTEMKRALIEQGVPSERIYCDYAGFRTLDSVVRANAIFGQDDFIVVSQRFHNQRALFLAAANGLDAIAFNAADASWTQGPRTLLREQLARAKAVLDVYLLHTEPRFYGPEVPLGPPQVLTND